MGRFLLPLMAATAFHRLARFLRWQSLLRQFGIRLRIGLLFSSLLAASCQTPTSSPAIVLLDASTTYQTISGWEAVAQAGELDFPNLFPKYQASLFDQAVNELGINRLRLEVNSQPAGTPGSPFDLQTLDRTVELVALPIKQRLESNHERLWLNVTVVGNELQDDPGKFASQTLAVYQHLQSRYSLVPDSWEILEPGQFHWKSAMATANALLAAAQLLGSDGFAPYIVTPSSECGAQTAMDYFDAETRSVPDLVPYIREFAYHRYCPPSPQDLQRVAQLGQRYGIATAQLEHIGSDYHDLHADLKLANVSAWEQYALAYPKCPAQDDGDVYYVISRCGGEEPAIQLGWRTRFLRQYFKYIRRGAVRIQATSTSAFFDPLAFVNTNSGFVVVVNATRGGQFLITGLPAGFYGIKYTTDHEYNVDLPSILLGDGQDLHAAIPEAGVVTIYTRDPAPFVDCCRLLPRR
jgi:hypothetical protein